MTPCKPANDGCDHDALTHLAEFYADIEEAAALLGIEPNFLRDEIEDSKSSLGAAWRRGRASARLSIRKAQFELMKTNASLAIHLGREYLGQGGGEPDGPITYIVDTGICRHERKTGPDRL